MGEQSAHGDGNTGNAEGELTASNDVWV